MAWPDVPCRGDVFHLARELQATVTYLENRADVTRADLARLERWHAPRRGPGRVPGGRRPGRRRRGDRPMAPARRAGRRRPAPRRPPVALRLPRRAARGPGRGVPAPARPDPPDPGRPPRRPAGLRRRAGPGAGPEGVGLGDDDRGPARPRGASSVPPNFAVSLTSDWKRYPGAATTLGGWAIAAAVKSDWRTAREKALAALDVVAEKHEDEGKRVPSSELLKRP